MTPDLEIRVKTHGDTRLSYVLRYAEGKGKEFDRRIEGPTIHVSPREYQVRMLKRLEDLGSAREVLAPTEVDKELEALGHDLYKELFPPELRAEYRQFREKIKTLLIVSDEPWIPWEIVKPYGTEGSDDFDDDFLCCRFEMTRWLEKGRPLLQEIAVASITAIEAGSSVSSKSLRSSKKEVGFLKKIADDAENVHFQPLHDAKYSDTMALLEKGGHDILLFVGHGEFETTHPDESRFLLAGGRSLRPRDLHGPIERKLQQDQPLVFFNSCQVAQQDFSLTRIGGWATRWVRECGCGAFVGPQWSVTDGLACLFSQSFFAALEAGKTFAQAARAARLKVRDKARGHPSWLAYTIYAHPNGQLRLGSQAKRPAQDPGPKNPERAVHEDHPYDKTLRHLSGSQKFRWQPALVAVALLVLLAAGFQWHFTNPKEAGGGPIDSPPGPLPPPPAVESKVFSEEPGIDIHALQKPPYSLHDVYFHIAWPAEADASTWMERFRTTAKAELIQVHLNFSRTTSAAWLVLIEFSPPKISGKMCRIQAETSIYHERKLIVGPESVPKTGNGFTEDAACGNAVYKVAESISRSVRTAYLDQTSEE